MKQSLFLLLTSTALALVCAASATAQETMGVPGSPSATTTIDGKQLPPPDPKFGGVIKDRASGFHALGRYVPDLLVEVNLVPGRAYGLAGPRPPSG